MLTLTVVIRIKQVANISTVFSYSWKKNTSVKKAYKIEVYVIKPMKPKLLD